MAIALQRWPVKPLGLGLLLLGISWSGSAEAEEKARLVYVRGGDAGECPAEVDLRLLVMARLGYDPFSPQASRVVLSRIERSGQQLVGSVEVVDQGGMATGRRELTARSGRCAELARALALSISLAIDPERASQTPPPAPTTPPPSTRSETPLPESPKPRAARTRPTTAAAEVARPRAFVGVAVAGSAGSLPGPALGGATSLGWRLGSASVALEALLQQSLSNDLAPRGTLTGALFSGGASACWTRGAWAVCGLATAGAQRLGTSGVTHPSATYGLHLAAGPRVTWALPLGPHWAVVSSLEGLLNLRRNGAALSGKEVWRTPPTSATLCVGVRTSFL